MLTHASLLTGRKDPTFVSLSSHGVLLPRKGQRFHAAEQEVWQAATGGAGGPDSNEKVVVSEWVVDVANGVVQDILIENCNIQPR
jgi:hypothetical protein